MIGLVLVATLLIVSIFADFFAPMDPKAPHISFAPPDTISFEAPDGSFSLLPYVYPIVETGEFDPITFQPLTGPDKTNPTPLGFFVKGYSYKLLLAHPGQHPLLRLDQRQPVHLLGTDKFGRDILSRGIIGSRISLTIALIVVTITTTIGTIVGITSGYIGGRFDAWLQRFVELVLAFPQLPLYLALTSLIPVTAPSNVFIAFVIGVLAALGWAQLSREVRGKTLALSRIEYVRAAMAVGAGSGRIIFRHILPNVLSHVIVAVTLAIPSVVLLESFLGFPRLCGEAAADLLGPDAAGHRHLLGDRLLPLDPLAGGLRADHRVRVQRARRRPPRRRRSLLRLTMADTPANPFAPAERFDLGAHGRELILDARNIAVTFKVEGGIVEGVRDVSFQLHKGETIALVGESGSGKSVTARTIMGLLTKRATVSPQTRILLDGEDITKYTPRQMRALRGNKISMIFQEPMTSLNPVYTIGQQITEILHLHNKMSRVEATRRAAALLEEVQIPEPEARLRQYPHQLSGGPAPARDDRHGARQPPGRADRRRADDGARRHRAGANPQPHQGAEGASTAWR